MGNTSFSDFIEEVKPLEIKNPRITISVNSLKLAAFPFFNDILVQLLLWGFCVIPLYESEFTFVAILLFGASLYFFYFHFVGLNVCLIDLASKTLTIKNRIFLFNWFRKMFGINQIIKFSDLKEISYKEGELLDRFGSCYQSRYLLLIESHEDAPVIAAQFKKEEEANAIASILRKFLLKNEEIIA